MLLFMSILYPHFLITRKVGLVDKIYATQENHRWLKERGIRITAPPLGRRPVKTKQSYYQKRKTKKEAAKRNHIEGKFGQGKNGYNLDEIRARLKNTSESWVACIFFVMNLIHYEANHFFGSFFRWIYGEAQRIQARIALLEPLPESKLTSRHKIWGKQYY